MLYISAQELHFVLGFGDNVIKELRTFESKLVLQILPKVIFINYNRIFGVIFFSK